MRNGIALAALLLALLVPRAAMAQGAIDWSISYPNDVPTFQSSIPSFIFPPITLTRDQVVRITVSNSSNTDDQGPFEARTAFSLGFSVSQVDASVLPPCAASISPVSASDPNSQYVFRWIIGAIPGGASVSCSFRMQARSTALTQGITHQIQLRRGNEVVLARLLGFTVSPVPSTTADLGVRVHPAPVVVPGGTTQRFDIELFNRGPGEYIQPTTVIRTTFYKHAFVFGAATPDPFWLGATGDPRCQVFVEELGSGQVNSRWLEIVFPTLMPGESRRCTLAVRAFPDAIGRNSVGFTVGNYGIGHFDPDVSNNAAYLELLFGAEPVPAGSWRSWLAMAALALLLGLWSQRRVKRAA